MSEYEIDIANVVEFTKTKNVYWCDDYFGMVGLGIGNFLIAEDDSNKNTSVKAIKNACYEENGTVFWLIY